MSVTIVVSTSPYGSEGPYNAHTSIDDLRGATIHDLAELVKECDEVVSF
jgi:sulfur relay (sulfurtransferase) complex TusBCD TusD component (DsrE family)